MPRLRRSGFTLTEVLFTATLGSVVFGAAASLWVLVARRTSVDTAESIMMLQATQVLDEIEQVAQRSVLATIATASGRQHITFSLPTGGVDLDRDGVVDLFTPQTVSISGRPVYGPATAPQIVAFFWSDTGALSEAAGVNSGQWLRRSFSAPAGGSASYDRMWSSVDFNTAPRWTTVRDVVYTLDSSSRRLTVRVNCSIRTSSQTRGSAAGPSVGQRTISVTRVIHMPLMR